jgi:hypothetical protein
LIDIREIDGERLLASGQTGDNVIAILTRLRSHGTAVQEIVRKVAELEEDARNFYLRALLELAGLRDLEELVEEEARKAPMYIDILENKVLVPSHRNALWDPAAVGEGTAPKPISGGNRGGLRALPGCRKP